MIALLVFAAMFLAFSNGANDNFKGFATVWGAHALSYRKALVLATTATLAGGLLSMMLATELVHRFSGSGLVPDDLAGTPAFLIAVALGAATTVMVATRTGFPVSTTHALIGAMIGAGLAKSDNGIDLSLLGSKFFLPLLLSPLLAAALGLCAYRALRARSSQADCLCLAEPSPPTATGASVGLAAAALPQLLVGQRADCDATSLAMRLSLSNMKDGLHILSGALICFARAVNDAPKLAALLLAVQVFDVRVSVGLVSVAMCAGGILLARRVAETMSLRLNQMDRAQGLSANLITATLVLGASKFGLPVSTTHVSVGSIAGVGAGGGTIDWTVFKNVLLSWLATLPTAASLAWIAAIIAT